jgi:histidine phosphotransferase ChpT
MSAVDHPDLTGLLGSRLCHDLISPVGAIGNGLELLGMSGSGPRREEMQLVADSVAQAQARIRFYRVAFGLSREDQAMGTPELCDTLDGVYGAGRLQVVWDVSGEVPRQAARLAFLMLLCVEAALARGGRVTVARDRRAWRVAGSGPRLRDLAPFWALLEGHTCAETLTPERVQFPLLAQQAAAMGLHVAVSAGEGGVTLHATPD